MPRDPDEDDWSYFLRQKFIDQYMKATSILSSITPEAAELYSRMYVKGVRYGVKFDEKSEAIIQAVLQTAV